MNPKTASQVQTFVADGLTVTASEPWFKVKVQVITKYLEAFTLHVAGRADEIIFVDLFAGNGLYALGHQKEIFPGAGFLSVHSGLPISRWIFCEHNPDQLEALNTRVQRFFSRKDVLTVNDAPATSLADRLEDLVPKRSGKKTAVFCLVDPFSLDVPYTLIQHLSGMGWNFLMPFTFPLNAHSDCRFYVEENQDRLFRFLGHSPDALNDAVNNWQFYQMLVRAYENNLLISGLNTGLSVHKIESHWLEVPTYSIGFFSHKISARAIQQEVQDLTYPQIELF